MSRAKEIVVLSGKGGTGKTSITASLALIAAEKVVMADCDVDAANMHLLTSADFDHSEEYFGGEIAVLEQESCIKCGRCKEVCRFDAVDFRNGLYAIDKMGCEGCGYCARVCPTKAIEMVPEKSGDLYISNIRSGTKMVHAKLSAGAENSGKLVAEVKKSSHEIAKNLGCNHILIDGAPGIGCPVASSLSGASLALLVTEPTKSALHDLKRVESVAKRFNVKMVAIINKESINLEVSQEIKEYLKGANIEYLLSLPFDRSFAKAMGEAKTIIEESPQIRNQLEKIWKKLIDRL